MSSNEDDYNDGEGPSTQGLKKRRIQRACDICRRKKIRCDGVQMPGNRCSNCVSYSLDCTYVEASKKRGPPKGYVENLENRVEKLDRLLRKLCPDPALIEELQDLINREGSAVPHNPSPLVATQQRPTFFHASPANSPEKVVSVIRGTSDNVPLPDELVPPDEDTSASIIEENLKRMTLDPSQYVFYGKSSGLNLVQTAMKLKKEYTEAASEASNKPVLLSNRTDEFWTLRDWELTSDLFVEPPQYIFPEADLASDLVDLYFYYINLYLPLLHRPTFDKYVADGLHHKDDRFAATYLLVCANGARFSDDSRVLLDKNKSDYHSAGWKWFNQVQMVKKSILTPPTLYDIHFYCLSVHFLQGSTAAQSCWTMLGYAIRLAQDVGAHRRKADQCAPTAENEQWKRAFWVIVVLDRMISSALGRPCAIHDEDFDLDLPVDCDDEYWDHPDPKQRFKQPEDKPSLITAFILFIKLNQILSFCLRTIYSINKSKVLLGFVGQKWEQQIVAELDSALNKWVDSVPDHLRWDPNREDDNFFNQSSSLYIAYYHNQILVHRPFIPSPSQPSSLSFPSLAICTNAARACSHILDIQRRRNPFPPLYVHMAAFTSGVVLLLNIWGGKRSGLSVDPDKEIEDVHKCMKALRLAEKRWQSMGRLWDILSELATAGDLPLPQASPMSTNKRERDSETPASTTSSEPASPMVSDDIPRAIAGSRRVNKDPPASGLSMRTGQSQYQQRRPPQPPKSTIQPSHSQQHPDRPIMSSHTLPVYGDDLGRLPLQGQPKFSAQAYVDQTNYWYSGVPNSEHSGGGAGESSVNPDHSVLSNSSSPSSILHHSSPHSQVQSSHNKTSTATQEYSLNPTIGTGNILFDTMSHTYIPPGPYSGASLPMDVVSSQDPGGRGSSHASFRGVPMDMRGGLGVVAAQRKESSSHLEQSHRQHHYPHTQGQREHDVHGNHNHHEQHPMGYSYNDNGVLAMWSVAPTGFMSNEWGTYLSNVGELTQGGHGGGQMHVQH